MAKPNKAFERARRAVLALIEEDVRYQYAEVEPLMVAQRAKYPAPEYTVRQTRFRYGPRKPIQKYAYAIRVYRRPERPVS